MFSLQVIIVILIIIKGRIILFFWSTAIGNNSSLCNHREGGIFSRTFSLLLLMWSSGRSPRVLGRRLYCNLRALYFSRNCMYCLTEIVFTSTKYIASGSLRKDYVYIVNYISAMLLMHFSLRNIIYKSPFRVQLTNREVLEPYNL